jgi:hypothetical protein
VAQHELSTVMQDLKGWTNNYNLTGWVFAARKLTSWSGQIVSAPENHAELCLVGIVRPNSYLDQCKWSWGSALDEEPLEQQHERIAQMRDYVDKKEHALRQRSTQIDSGIGTGANHERKTQNTD